MAYAQVLEALADPTRREIFELLRKGPMAVGEIARHLPISRPAVSQHLRVLKDAGLVAGRPDGTRRVYSLHPAGLAETREWFDAMWDRALAAYKQAAEPDGGPARRGGPQLLARVVGDLRRRALGPDLVAEVDRQLPGGLACLGKSSTASTRPTRMSTLRKSSNSIIGAPA